MRAGRFLSGFHDTFDVPMFRGGRCCVTGRWECGPYNPINATFRSIRARPVRLRTGDCFPFFALGAVWGSVTRMDISRRASCRREAGDHFAPQTANPFGPGSSISSAVSNADLTSGLSESLIRATNELGGHARDVARLATNALGWPLCLS